MEHHFAQAIELALALSPDTRRQLLLGLRVALLPQHITLDLPDVVYPPAGAGLVPAGDAILCWLASFREKLQHSRPAAPLPPVDWFAVETALFHAERRARDHARHRASPEARAFHTLVGAARRYGRHLEPSWPEQVVLADSAGPIYLSVTRQPVGGCSHVPIDIDGLAELGAR